MLTQMARLSVKALLAGLLAAVASGEQSLPGLSLQACPSLPTR